MREDGIIRLKIGMVCKRFSKGWYTRYLCEALSSKLNCGEIIFYSPINLNIIDMPNGITVKKIWNTKNFPFKLFREVLLDDLDIIHIQFEFNILGPLWSSPLVFLALFMLNFLRTKVVLTFHGPLFSNRNDFNNNIKDLAPHGLKKYIFLLKGYILLSYFLIYNLSKIIIVHSESSKYWLIKCGINPIKLYVIPIGVNSYDESFIKLNMYEKYSISRNKKIILYFGVLSPRKGVKYLIKAFSIIHTLIQDSILVIVGKEQSYYVSYKNELKRLVQRLGLDDKVIFTGYINEEELKSIISSSTIIVFPYISSISSSATLARAIEFGKPIVATNIGCFSEILKNGYNSLLVKPKDINKLAEAMYLLLNKITLRREISDRVMSMQEIYSWDKVANMTLEAYQA